MTAETMRLILKLDLLGRKISRIQVRCILESKEVSTMEGEMMEEVNQMKKRSQKIDRIDKEKSDGI